MQILETPKKEVETQTRKSLITPGQQPQRPPLQQPPRWNDEFDPFAPGGGYHPGRGDLDPLGRYPDGGMLFRPPSGGIPDPRFPQHPPGSRFDPYHPFRGPAPNAFGPNNDVFRPPGNDYDDNMYM